MAREKHVALRHCGSSRRPTAAAGAPSSSSLPRRSGRTASSRRVCYGPLSPRFGASCPSSPQEVSSSPSSSSSEQIGPLAHDSRDLSSPVGGYRGVSDLHEFSVPPFVVPPCDLSVAVVAEVGPFSGCVNDDGVDMLNVSDPPVVAMVENSLDLGEDPTVNLNVLSDAANVVQGEMDYVSNQLDESIVNQIIEM